jgi:hypothetical protein
MDKNLIEKVESLITKASISTNSIDALQFSQAALNAANALSQLNFVKGLDKEKS